jgi:hypothetical protein
MANLVFECAITKYFGANFVGKDLWISHRYKVHIIFLNERRKKKTSERTKNCDLGELRL